MLDDDDGAALVNEPMKNINELGDIMSVQANGWFFQNVESRLATTGRLSSAAAVARRASCETSLIRWASPPLNVGLGWPSFNSRVQFPP